MVRKKDPTRGISLNVTQEILTVAEQRNSSHCVLAEALKVAVPGATRVSVDIATIRFSLPDSKKRYIYLTPSAAQRAIVNFDAGEKSEPFSVRLGRPAQIVATQSPEEKRRRNQRRKPRVTEVASGSGRPVVKEGKAPPSGPGSNVTGTRRTYGVKSLTR